MADSMKQIKPGYSVKNISGGSLSLFGGPGESYGTIYGKIAKDDIVIATKKKGNWYFIPSLNGWAKITIGEMHCLKIWNSNGSAITNLIEPEDPNKSNIRTDTNTTRPPENTKTHSQASREAAEEKAEQEREKAKRIQQRYKDTTPYQSWVDSDSIPQDDSTSGSAVSYDAGWTSRDGNRQRVVPGSTTFTGKSRQAVKELQRISQQDFIIQPNLQKEKRFGMFDRVGILDPTAKLISTKEYVFFTKPDLNIFYDTQGHALSGCNFISTEGATYKNDEQNYTGLFGIPIFEDALIRYKDVLAQLQRSVELTNYKWQSPFMNLLSNNIKSPIDLPTINAEETSTAVNAYGTSISYRESSEKSDEGFEFNIEFEDTKYLEVYMLFKLYDEYERKKKLGIIGPKEKYILNRVLHDQFSIYKFVVAEDGESLIYWAKFYGVYPKGVPRDVMNEIGTDGKVRFTVPFKCQFMDDMDPSILQDFNYLVDPTNKYHFNAKMSMPAMDPETQMGNIRFGMVPFITSELKFQKNASLYEKVHRYKLRWIENIEDLSQHRYFDNFDMVDSDYKTPQEWQHELDIKDINRRKALSSIEESVTAVINEGINNIKNGVYTITSDDVNISSSRTTIESNNNAVKVLDNN